MSDLASEYLQTVSRLEPEISPVDPDGALTSIAISLKRIADVIEAFTKPSNNFGENWLEAIGGNILRGLNGDSRR